MRGVFCRCRFPLVSPLPSTTSSAGASAPAPFGGFAGTMGLSDFPEPCVIGVRLAASRHGPQLHPLRAPLGSPGSRAWWFRACTGSVTARGPERLALATHPVWPSASPYSVGTPESSFAAEYPARPFPCRRFDAALAGAAARPGAGVDR